MTEFENNQGETPPPKKDELHTVSTPDMVFVPRIGFVEAPNKASITLGNEEKILEMLRAQGLSEEAIAAVKSGKIIKVIYQETPFGPDKISETWQGKEEEKPTSSLEATTT